MGWLPLWATLAGGAPRAVNRLARTPILRDLAKTAAGVDRRRTIPEFAPESFQQWFRRRSASRAGERGEILLWPDTFTNRFHPGIARAAVAVLESAGWTVRVPQEKVCCGLTWISTGQLDMAKRVLNRSLGILRPHVRSGGLVLGLEPSCTAVFRSDAPELFPDDPDVHRLQQQTVTFAELLNDHTPGWSPPAIDVRALIQKHCHQHAVMGFEHDTALLDAMGVDTTVLDSGCCGLAGNFGFEQGHYEVSEACGERVLLPAVRSAPADDVILADGFSCRTQIEQSDSAGRRALHLAELVDAARRHCCTGDFPERTCGPRLRLDMTTIERLDVATYRIPLERPESDGTLTWDHTTVVVVESTAAGVRGLGFTYATRASATLIQDVLKPVVTGLDADDPPQAWRSMVAAIRNLGRPGICSTAIAAVDIALWDLKARLADRPLYQVLGAVREDVPIYGSGGFTSFTDDELCAQLGGWVHEQRIPRVKMKIGTEYGRDEQRDLAPRRARAAGDRRRRRALRRRERRVHAQAGGPTRPVTRHARRHVVRGTGLVRRPRRIARDPVPRRPRRRGGGVRLRPRLLRTYVRGRSGGLSPSRRQPVRGHHRMASRGLGRGRARPRDLGTLRAVAACASRLRDPEPSPRRVLRRPRARRPSVVRRRPRTRRWGLAARPVPAGSRVVAACRGRTSVPGRRLNPPQGAGDRRSLTWPLSLRDGSATSSPGTR